MKYRAGNRLAGKVAIITGAAQGQGAAEAALFVAEGAKVVIGDVLEAPLMELADALGDDAVGLRFDVRDAADWERAIEAAADLGPLDILVNNAGVMWTRPIEHETADGLRELFEVNTVGVFLGMQAALGPMRESGGGSIINVSSMAGMTAYPYHGAYGASKWAVRGLTRTAAIEWGEYGIRVNSVHPGPIATAMLPPAKGGSEATRFAGLPLGRVGQPDEVAHLALYLASDDSSFQTGGEYIIDGGSNAGKPKSYEWSEV